MKKPIAIIAGEPNSISSEIIFKSWKQRKRYKSKPIIIIGSFKILNAQNKKLKYKINLRKVTKEFKNINFNNLELLVYDVFFNQKKPFDKITTKSNKYILKCFELAIKLASEKKILGFINCPISKETLFKKKHQGITEYLGKKSGIGGSEAMLIYNKNLAVVPLTTHIPIKQISNNIKKEKIVNKILIVNNFYKKILKRKPTFAVLGLNPHNFSSGKAAEEKKIIIPAIKKILKKKIKVIGPISPDTAFIYYKNHKIDIIVGMYHDQVLSPFKLLFKYNAINITIGLPYIRISPDHGVGNDITGKKIANPESLIESIKFFNKIK